MENDMEENQVTSLFKRIVSAVTLVCFTITGVMHQLLQMQAQQ